MLQTQPLNKKPVVDLRPTNTVANVRGRTETFVQEPNEEQIRLRAYEVYVARGAQPGREAEDWAKAEKELRAGNRP